MLPGADLESRLGYRFQDRGYLTKALTHRSYAADHAPRRDSDDNEQLEFLGDAVLGFAVSEALVAQNPSAREGALSRLKAHLVSSTHLYQCALDIGLGEYLLLGKGEERNGGRARKALLADAFEAVIAAICLDGGIHAALTFVRLHVLQPLQHEEELASIEQLNHKSILQERTQARGMPTPHYVVVEAMGPEHAKTFVVEARVGNELSARASGTSKKSASQAAAEALLSQVKPIG